MFRLSTFIVVSLLPFLLAGEERWVEFRSGPFQVFSNTGEKPGREMLMELEQFRQGFGVVLGKPDLHSVWPIRIIVSRNAKIEMPLKLRRDGFVGTGARFTDLARILLDSNTRRLPAPIETGLIELFSTLQVDGTHLKLGNPISEPNRDWARMHMFAVEPEFSGKMRVLISNYENGADPETAYRNSFEKSGAEVEKRVEAYFTAGKFDITTVSGRAVDPRDFAVRTVDAGFVATVLADLDGSAAAYTAVLNKYPNGPYAHEGLGLVSLAEGNRADALRELTASSKAESKSARAYLELALLETDSIRAKADLEKSAQLNPRWGEPSFRLALSEANVAKKAQLLKTAATLEPRRAEYWRALAETEVNGKRFPEAAKAWVQAERASENDAERARMRAARASIEQQRNDYEIAERKRIAEEARRDLERVKNASLANIRMAEAKANEKLSAGRTPMGGKVEEWWEGPQASGKLEGVLERVDCLSGHARLLIKGADGKRTRLLVRDPSQIVITGGGEKTLGCGTQNSNRSLVVQYAAKPDKKLGTAGEALTIEFR